MNKHKLPLLFLLVLLIVALPICSGDNNKRLFLSRTNPIPIPKKSYCRYELPGSCPEQLLRKRITITTVNESLLKLNQFNRLFKQAQKQYENISLPIFFTSKSAEQYKQFGITVTQLKDLKNELFNQFDVDTKSIELFKKLIWKIDKAFRIVEYCEIHKKILLSPNLMHSNNMEQLLSKKIKISNILRERHHIDYFDYLEAYVQQELYDLQRETRLHCFKQITTAL